MARRRTLLRLHSILALTVFLLGAGSHAYGYHGCDHHGAPAGADGHGAAHGEQGATPAVTAVDHSMAAVGHSKAHGGLARHAAHAGPPPDGGRIVAAAPAGHGTPHAAAGGHGTTDPEPHGGCTCVGTCFGGAGFAVAAAAPALEPAEAGAGARAAHFPEDAEPRLRPAYLLPYSTAPPHAG